LKSHPKFSGFSKIPSVIQLLKLVSQQVGFTPSGLARSFCRYLQTLSSKPSSIISTAPLKPSALYIKEMYSVRNFQCGSSKIPSKHIAIDPNAVMLLHVKFCSLCSQSGVLQNNCYFFNMYMVLKNGWLPYRLSDNEPTPKYNFDNNLSSDDKFLDLKMSQISKYLAKNILEVINPDDIKYPISLTPISIAFRNADLHRVKSISNISIKSSESLTKANNLLIANNLSIIKPRPVFDFKGSGLNEVLWTMPFSNCGINDAIALINPNDWMAIGDFEGYYTMFVIANEFKRLMALSVNGDILMATRILFGISSAPAFCATFTAEILHWLIAQAIRAVAMTDDFFLVNSTKYLVSNDMSTLKNMTEPCGFKFAEEKFQIGQVVTFLGVQIDSVKMVISFNPEKAKACADILSSFIDSLISNKPPTLAALNSTAGKLNDFAQVISGGRIRIRACWEYIYKVIMPNVKYPDKKYLRNLISNLKWWIAVLIKWSNSSLTGNEFPILNSAVLLSHPERINCVQSDASGTDGLGFIFGNLYTLNPEFYSERWAANFNKSDNPFDKNFFDNIDSNSSHESFVLDNNSHNFELEALLRYLQLRKALNLLTPCSTLIWITDSSSAVWSINKGYCSSEKSFQTLSKIFELVDELFIHIVAIWISRDDNLIADDLSHLSSFLNRNATWGRLGDEAYEFDKRCFGEERFSYCPPETGRQLHSILLSESKTPLSTKAEIYNPISVSTHDSKQRINEVSSSNSVKSENLLREEPDRLDRFSRSVSPCRMDRRSSLSGSNSIKPESSFDSRYSSPAIEGFNRFSVRSYSRGHDVSKPRCSSAPQGGKIKYSDIQFNLGSKSCLLRCPSSSHQNSQNWNLYSYSNSQKKRTLRCESFGKVTG